jgi:hypothetical protein
MNPSQSYTNAVPSGSTAIIDLDGKRWALNGDHVVAIENIDDVEGSTLVFSDFEGAFTRVESVASEKRYSAAIIEKQLRDRGDTDGVSNVLLIAAKTTSHTTNVLYTAVAAERFTNYCNRAVRQKDHCLLIPMLSVLYRYGMSVSGESSAVLLQYGANLYVLLISRGQPVSCISVTASGAEAEDWDRALHYLGDQIKHVNNTLKPPLAEIQWFSWDPNGTTEGQGLSDKLGDILDIPVRQAAECSLTLDKKGFTSSLPSLLRFAHVNDDVSGNRNKILYLSERILPWAAALLLGISCALFAAGHYWQGTTLQYEQLTAKFQQQVSADEVVGISAQVASKQLYSQTDAGKALFSFVQHLHQALFLPSLPKIVADIRAATPAAMRVSRITLVPDQKIPQIIVDGQIDQDLQMANNDIGSLISGLRERGYHVQDNGLLANDLSKHFQIVLIMNGAQNEI